MTASLRPRAVRANLRPHAPSVAPRLARQQQTPFDVSVGSCRPRTALQTPNAAHSYTCAAISHYWCTADLWVPNESADRIVWRGLSFFLLSFARRWRWLRHGRSIQQRARPHQSRRNILGKIVFARNTRTGGDFLNLPGRDVDRRCTAGRCELVCSEIADNVESTGLLYRRAWGLLDTYWILH